MSKQNNTDEITEDQVKTLDRVIAKIKKSCSPASQSEEMKNNGDDAKMIEFIRKTAERSRADG